MTQENSIDDIYSAFDMDEDAETRGIPVNYGKFVVTIARILMASIALASRWHHARITHQPLSLCP